MSQVTPRGKWLLGQALGVGTGVGGFVKGMTHAEPAHANVMDQTQTQEYRKAQSAIQAGQGDSPTRSGSLWQALSKTGPTPRETAAGMEQEQQRFEADLRKINPGATVPSEQRMLREMNQVNPKAYQGWAQ